MRVYVASATMTKGTPARIACRNDRRYGSSSVVVVSTTWAVKSVLPVTRPSPGKCLAVVATPADCMPRMNAAPWRPVVTGSWPNSRWSAPMGWFSASVPGGTTSMTGAKFRLTPAEASWRPHSAASARSAGGAMVPWSSALGIVENPGPRSAWISPPS